MAPPGSRLERNSVSAVGAKISGGVGGSSLARSLPGRIRASVMCGRKRSMRRLPGEACGQLAAERAVQVAQRARRGRPPRPRARAGAAAAARPGRRPPALRPPRTLSICPASTRGDLLDHRRRLLSEEAQRQVQRLGGQPARAGAASERPPRPVRELAADLLGRLDRDEQPQRRASRLGLAGGTPTAGAASRCMAVITVRSRTSARVPRCSVRRTIACRPARRARSRPGPTGFSERAAARPGDARDADPDVGADALARPRRRGRPPPPVKPPRGARSARPARRPAPP